MVDLSGGPDGPIEHGFSNTVFIIPAIVVVGLAVPVSRMEQSGIDRRVVQDLLDGRGKIEDGVEIPENFVHEAPASSVESLLYSLDNIEGLTHEEKLELRKEVLRAMAGESEEVLATGYFGETLVFLLALAVIVSILAFFGLKLYRSLSEKERKREEKRRLKQQKKKK